MFRGHGFRLELGEGSSRRFTGLLRHPVEDGASPMALCPRPRRIAASRRSRSSVAASTPGDRGAAFHGAAADAVSAAPLASPWPGRPDVDGGASVHTHPTARR